MKELVIKALLDGFLKVIKLIDVKSIMTLILTISFVMLVKDGKISGEQFLAVFTMIVGFYFGTQNKKGG